MEHIGTNKVKLKLSKNDLLWTVGLPHKKCFVLGA